MHPEALAISKAIGTAEYRHRLVQQACRILEARKRNADMHATSHCAKREAVGSCKLDALRGTGLDAMQLIGQRLG